VRGDGAEDSKVQMFKATLFFILVTIISVPGFARHHKKKFMDETAQALRAAMVVPPRDLETCFSPDEPCDIKLIKFVSGAKKSIDVAIYDINLDQLVHQLLVQKIQNLKVRVVVDRRQAKGDHSLVPLLIKAGAQVRYGHQRGIMHDKFTIVDGGMVETGSFNYTNHASEANQENQIYLSNPLVTDRYRARFEKIWSTAREFEEAAKPDAGAGDESSNGDTEP